MTSSMFLANKLRGGIEATCHQKSTEKWLNTKPILIWTTKTSATFYTTSTMNLCAMVGHSSRIRFMLTNELLP